MLAIGDLIFHEYEVQRVQPPAEDFNDVSDGNPNGDPARVQ